MALLSSHDSTRTYTMYTLHVCCVLHVHVALVYSQYILEVGVVWQAGTMATMNDMNV